MDQKFVAGLGNIYVNETLFLCKIRPDKLGSDIKDNEIRKIIHSIKKILKNAEMTPLHSGIFLFFPPPK